MRKFLAGFLSVYLLFFGLSPARAQNDARLYLFALQTGAFPSMTVGLDVFDATGNFVTGLSPAAVTLLEDNQPIPPISLEELQPGAEFALALDPGPFFAYRDANAVTRFSKVVKVIEEWIVAHPDSAGDDLSLLLTGGTPATHLATSAPLSDTLAAYQPNLQSLVSSPETLSLALDTVSEPTSQTGRKPVVLYITSIPTAADIPVLQNLTQRAAAGFIRVHVWIVASKDFFSTSGATVLKDLAIQTGGQYFLFSGIEPLPSPDSYLSPLRHAYRVGYKSNILTTGGHTLAARVTLNGETVNSETVPFELDIQPPNPILVAPPGQIVRTAPDEHTTAISSFIPTLQVISIIIEFPDGRTRPLVRTALYVDGILAAENTVEPFDHFSWDLKDYLTSSQHILTVEAVDDLGLKKVSVGVPVQVTIVRPQVGLLPWLSRNSMWVALGATLFAGVGLGVILARSRVKKYHSITADRASRHDPLTQSVFTARSKSGLRLPWNTAAKSSSACLVRLKDDGQPVTAPPIPITMPETTFGSDPIQVTYIIDDPSVSLLHARLKAEHGEYILSDEKSAAGTWVNYELLTTPRLLHHADVLHFGRLSYRFLLNKPPEPLKPRVIPLKK